MNPITDSDIRYTVTRMSEAGQAAINEMADTMIKSVKDRSAQKIFFSRAYAMETVVKLILFVQDHPELK
jgi:hypothetical protein